MASPKIQIKRGTVVPPYTLSTGELALNTNSKNLFVQTGDGSLSSAGSEIVQNGVVFTAGTVTTSGSGASLVATFEIVTSGATGYNARLFNVGTVLKINSLTTSEFYVTSVTNATTFNVRQVGNNASAQAVTLGVLTSVQLYANSMTWIGAQIDTAINGTGSYDRLVSQKGITDYVAAYSASSVTLNEMGDQSTTYYPVFANSNGSSVYRDATPVTSGTVPSYNPSNNILSAKIFSGAHEGTVGATNPTSGAFSTVNATGQITSTLNNGAAPFVVASSTNVANLNASSLNGATFAVPGAIGGTTPGTGAFSTVNATGQITSTLNNGAAPFVVASSTNVANLNASSLNGATFAVPGAIGGTTPGTGAFTNLTTSGTTTINGNLLVNNTQTYLNTTIMQVVDKNIELGVGQSITSSEAYASSGFTNSSTTLTTVQITGTAGQFSCTDTTGAVPPQTLVVGQLVTISGTFGGTGSITGYSNPTTYKISATNGKTTFTLTTLADGAIVTTTGAPTGLTLTIGLRPYFANQGTVNIVSSTTAKITFSTSGLIPVGIRIGSKISGGNVGAGTNTITSITPTEIYYTYTSGQAPTAGLTTLLAVTNDYTGTVTFSNAGATTAKIAVGATFSCTGFTAATATVSSITSDTVFTISNRDAVVSTGTTAGNSLYADTGGLTAITIGTNSDSIADGGGFTVKGTTDKTLTWIQDSNRSINTTKGYFSFNQPLQAYTSLGSDNSNLSTLILTANNTNTTPTNPVASIIEFETITTGISTKGYFGMRNDRILSYSMTGPGDIIGSSVFSVTSTGLVGDCTIDCGTF